MTEFLTVIIIVAIIFGVGLLGIKLLGGLLSLFSKLCTWFAAALMKAFTGALNGEQASFDGIVALALAFALIVLLVTLTAKLYRRLTCGAYGQYRRR